MFKGKAVLDDRLFLYIDTRFAPADIDINFTTPDRAFAPQGMRLTNFTAEEIIKQERLGQTLFADLSAQSLEVTANVVAEAAKLQRAAKKPTRVILIVKAVTTHAVWGSIIGEAKDIVFLQGRIRGNTGGTALAIVVFCGVIKGCPMVYVQDVNALEELGEFSRAQLLYSRHTQR